jgi:hypothetical protein
MPEPLKPGIVNNTLQQLRQLQKAPQKEGMPQGGVGITYDLTGGFVSGTFIFPITQQETDEGSIIKAVDFVEIPDAPSAE